MLRRTLLKTAAALPLASGFPLAEGATANPFRRVRPADPDWPTAAEWDRLSRAVGGRLQKIANPFAACVRKPQSPACAALFANLKNPFFIGDNAALTETLGWTDAWTSHPSEYVVAAETSADVVAAVNFARERRLRLVVKGGGHSYLGGSNAADSLLIWTRAMRTIELHDAFVPRGAPAGTAPAYAVSTGAGAMWLDLYDAVTTKGGRYVQGGGCTTVGVASLVQGGGFGSFSKGFGTGAANLLEAEIVTADGTVRIANAFTNPELFWALKGGGGGTFGVVTRLTLRTHELPATFGAVQLKVAAQSDTAWHALVEQMMTFYATSLMNPHWGEQIRFSFPRQLSVEMVFQGLGQKEAEQAWQPFFDWLSARAGDYNILQKLVFALPARRFWDPTFLAAIPGIIKTDDRPGVPKGRFHWAGDGDQVGQVIHAYKSAWIPKDLLGPERLPALVDALVHAAASWGVSLHCNKGLAGASAEVLAWTKDTATNPAVMEAFALAISGGGEQPAYPGISGHEPDTAKARREAETIRTALAPLLALPPKPAAYISETDYFEDNWQSAFWGEHYSRLVQIKRLHDPEGLFFVHHSVGSEGWSEDGFARAG